MDKQTQLLDLNNDCLGYIFMKLSHSDLNRLHKVCKRFEEVLLSYCRSKFITWRRMKADDEHFFNSCDKADRPVNFIPDDPSNFMTDFEWLIKLQDIVEELELPHLTFDELLSLRSNKFLKLKSLKVITLEQQPARTQEMLKVFTNSFPNISKLIIESNITDLSPILDFPNLIELELYIPDNNLNAELLSPIFRQLKLVRFYLYSSTIRNSLEDIKYCNTLKEIAVSSNVLNDAIQLLKYLPKLNKFTYIDVELFEGEDAEWGNIFAPFAKRVKTFYSAFMYIQLNVRDLSEMQLLEKLYFNNQSLLFNDLSTSEESPLCPDLPSLREIHFLRPDTYFQRIDLEIDDAIDVSFLNIIEAFHNLEVLTIPHSWINKKFQLDELNNILLNRKNRNRPLELRCWITKETEIDFKNFENEHSSECLVVRVINYPGRDLLWSSTCFEYLQFELCSLDTLT